MEAQDKITEQIREAARNIESSPSFPAMDRVWDKVEAKLDQEQERKIIPFWKKGIAAAVLVLISISALYLLRREDLKADHPVVQIPVKETIPNVKPKESIAKVPPVKEGVKQTVAQNTNNKKRNKARINAERPGLSSTVGENDAAAVSMDPPVVARIMPGKIEGVVVDEQMQPVPGALVTLKGTDKSTITDIDGRYELEARNKSGALVIQGQGLGFEDKEVTIKADSNLLVTRMKARTGELQEVTILGAKIDKRSYSGSSTTFTAQEIAKRPVADLMKMLDGSAPGVQMTSGGGQPVNDMHPFRGNVYQKQVQGAEVSGIIPTLVGGVDSKKSKARKKQDVAMNSGGGQPGATPDILIRGVGSLGGNNAPLIVVDGAPYHGTLLSIDPNNVASTTFLKDATATGLYGTRGANGVLIVVTKKGARHQAGSFFGRTFRKIKTIFKKKKDNRTSALTPQATTPEVEVAGQEDYSSFVENPFENPATQPLSTFSIDVDNASYTNIRRFINNRQTVPKDAVRVEEMINYFSYQYPQPKDQHPFSIHTEYSDAPWNPQHRLLKIGLQGKIIPTEMLPASNLVFLVDVSGSMESPNKLPLLRESMKLLVGQLREKDKVAIVVYAGAAGLVLPSTSGSNKAQIIEALDKLQAGGSTAGGAGIQLAYQVAKENFIKDGNNRVILATDGDFNVGASSDADMQTLIEGQRKTNIFLTCLGYGMGNYKDAKMEILADKGNGNYAYIDNIGEANRVLVKEFGGTMYSIAKDVKIQIEFNPAYVQSYRLIGYENRKLRTEDFVNDAIDAGELGSGHTVTALYEIIPSGVESTYAPSQTGLKYTTPRKATAAAAKEELATVKFRYKQPDGDKSIEMIKVIGHQPVSLASSSADFKLAASAAWFGLKLRASTLIPDTDKTHMLQLARQGVTNDKEGYKAELVRLIETVQ